MLRKRTLIVIHVLFIGTVLGVFSASATELGTPTNYIPGQNAFGTAVGIYGNVQVGNNELSGETLSDLVGGGGNAVTVCFPNALASDAQQFTITATGCSSSGTQAVNITANNAQGVCNDIGVINQGCTWRNESCTHNGSEGGKFDIVGPFLCSISNWEFITGIVPAKETTIQITEITDVEAANVDLFRLTVDGSTTISINSAGFASVTNGTQMATLIGNHSTLINASYSGTTLTISAVATGPTEFTNPRLEFITASTTASVEVTGVTDANANVANRFNIKINGSNAPTGGLNFSSVSNGSQLASVLNGVNGIDVSYDNSNDKLDILASSPGAVTFSQVSLGCKPELFIADSVLSYAENDPALVVDSTISIGPSGSEAYSVTSATVSLSPFSPDDTLAFTSSGGLTGSYEPTTGVLSLSNIASRNTYAMVLRTVTYINSSDAPDTTQRQITFGVNDSDDASVDTRLINITAENDAPDLTSLGSSVEYTEDAPPVTLDSGITVTDLDNANLVSAVVEISTGFQTSLDVLTYSGSTLTPAWNGTSGILALTGTATVAEYQTALRSVVFSNSSQTPSTAARTIGFRVSDGTDSSNTGTINVTVISINDTPELINNAVPIISGTTKVDNTLTSSSGNWDDADGDTLAYSYQWYRADGNSGTNEITIPGASAANYLLTNNEAHKYLRVTVTVDDNNGGTASASTGRILVDNSAPIFTSSPSIVGTAKVGRTFGLTNTDTNDIDNDTVTLTYHWAADGIDIIGATLNTYKLTASEAKKTITCTITANDGHGGAIAVVTSGVDVTSFPWLLIEPGLISPNKVKGDDI